MKSKARFATTLKAAKIARFSSPRLFATGVVGIVVTTSNVAKPLNETNPSWVLDRLAECIDALIAAWGLGGAPPNLAPFVVALPTEIRSLALVELIKVDLEHRWDDRRAPKLLEAYLLDFPELCADGVPCDLIYEEYHIRKQLGDSVDAQDYFERFPAHASELGRLLGLEGPHVTTTIVTGERLQQVKVGEEIDDFALLTELGKGAFASVYLARQKSMQRIVALKISDDKGNEPQTLAQLDHPHIVRVYDQRQLPERRLRLLYMQHISGGTLEGVRNYASRLPATSLSGKSYLAAVDEALDKKGESPPSSSSVRHKLQHANWPQVICWLGARLSSALAYAHNIGVLHRDIKPANVLVAADGSPKLADFNISFSSKLEGASPAAYFGGSLAYMSPEQLEACDPRHERQAEDLDGRSDIYSLGIMLWELLTGERPFRDEMQANWSRQLTEMTARRRAGVSEAARSRLPANCPPGLEPALLRCLSPNVKDRFASAGELARALDLCLQPRAQKLLQMPQGKWRQLPRRWPVTTLVIAGLLANLVMSGLNILYNWTMIIEPLSRDSQLNIVELFKQAMMFVNSVAFPVGVMWVLYKFFPVVRAVRTLSSGKPIDTSNVVGLRERSLKLGDYAALVSTLEWAVSGFIFSTWLKLPPNDFLHFLTSQVLCGLIAATLTFFCVTHVTVRMFYPWLVQSKPPEAEEAGQLQALGRRLWIYFGGAVSVPFLSIFPLILLDSHRIAVGVLAAVGLAAFALAFRLDRDIRSDLGALTLVVNPGGETLGATDTESFWSS